MNISKIFSNISESISSAVDSFFKSVARIFGPRDDDYPEVGVQPFGGESYNENQ